jgi:3-deoxy-D-manno-octulosonic-acid transferase
MGDLPVFLAAADAAFIGGSLVPTGGHNPLVAEGAAVQLTSAEGLADLMGDWLTDATLRTRIGEQGRLVVERNRGALQRLIELIEFCLNSTDNRVHSRSSRTNFRI